MLMTNRRFWMGAATTLVLGAALTGCSTVRRAASVLPGIKAPSSSGKSASGGNSVRAKQVAPRMGVNEYLWRASLETLNFMPLSEVDPFGGVIITDWYASPQEPDERFKGNVYILDTNLRADALKVSIFKQVRSQAGWTDASVDADTARSIENSILTRARELYIATVDAN